MLYFSQPGLSKNINELERLLGVELFDRSAEKLSLTQSGKYLLRGAKKLIADADRIEKEVRIIDSFNKNLCTIAVEDKVVAIWSDELFMLPEASKISIHHGRFESVLLI